MSSAMSHPGRPENGKNESNSIVEQLRQQSERLRELADRLEAREAALADMEANYPYFPEIAYKHLRDEFQAELGDLPDKDLETIARETNSEPLEAFIAELQDLARRP